MTSHRPVKPQRILVVLHGSIGDVTRALPLANLLRRNFPEATLTWSVEPPSLPLVEQHPAVDKVILFERLHWWKRLGRFLRQIRAGGFDLVLDLQRHLKSGMISRWSGAPFRLGFHRRDCKELNWVFNNHHIPAVGERVSKLKHYLQFAEYLGLVPRPVEWKLSLTQAEEMGVQSHLKNLRGGFATLFVGSRWESKGWLGAQIVSCAKRIHEGYGLGVVLLGGSSEAALAKEVESSCSFGITNLVGLTSLKEAVGIIARAEIAVGPDTGLMHIAGAVGTPVVSLWGATSSSRNAPYGFEALTIQGKADCSPCYRKRCPIGRICMQSIDVEAIMAKVELGLSRKRKDVPAYETQR